MQGCHLRQCEIPLLVARAIDVRGVRKRPGIVKPLVDGSILVLVQFQLNRLERLHVLDVLRPAERRLFVVEWWESHTLEVATIALLASHSYPHRGPLCMEDRLDNTRDLVYKRQAAVHMVQHLDLTRRLPRHGHIFQQLQHSMWHELERTQITPLVTAELLLRNISNVSYDLSQVLRGHVCFLCLDKASTALLCETLSLMAHPFLLLLLLLGQFRVDRRSSEARGRWRHADGRETWWCAWGWWGLPAWRRRGWEASHDRMCGACCVVSMNG